MKTLILHKGKINSVWEQESGDWNYKTFVNRKVKKYEKEISIQIIEKNNKLILNFNGPTGFEEYYLADLDLESLKDKDFCICGGTINSWPRCTVKGKDVIGFIEGEKENLNV